ncbi:MAG: T9SS type A sorting domain-containing protein [Bacteroidales bacterium]
MKKTFITAILLILVQYISNAQDSYQVLFRNGLNDGVCSMIEDNSGNIIAVGGRNTQDYYKETNRGTIWKINSATDTLSKTISFDDTASYFGYIEQKGNGNFLVIGILFLPPAYETNALIFLELDSNLEKVSQKSLAINGSTSIGVHLVKKFNNEYYVFGNLLENNIDHKRCIIKLDSDLDTIRTQLYDDPSHGGGLFMDCILSPDSNQLWTFCYAFTSANATPDDLFVFDTSLNFIYSKPFPHYLNPVTYDIEVAYEHNMTVKWITDSTFLVGCNHLRTFNHQQDIEEDIGFSEMDSILGLVPVTYKGATDTNDYATYFRGTFDFKVTDSIVYSGTKNQISEFWPHNPSWIKAGMMSKSLHPYYDRYYGGDAYYRSMIIKSTSDGGSVIAATRYDYLTQNSECDVIFIKLNPEGLITGYKDNEICPYTIFNLNPNPANEYLNVLLIIHKAEMKIYDVSGSLIFQEQIIEGKNLIDCRHLKSGLYTCEITTPKGEVFTKKWIKQ